MNSRYLYSRGMQALLQHNSILQQEVLNELSQQSSEAQKECYESLMHQALPAAQHVPIVNLSPEEVYINLANYCQVLHEELYSGPMTQVSVAAILHLREHEEHLNHHILYENNISPTLTVGDLLKAISLVCDSLSLFGMDTDKYKQGILVLRGLEKILKNQKVPDVWDNLGYGVELMGEFLKRYIAAPEEKRKLGKDIALVSLALEFFRPRVLGK